MQALTSDLRPASIAPDIVGITFSTSFGVWKRCAVFSARSFQGEYHRLWNTFELLLAVRTRADASTLCQRECLEMALCASPSPRA